MRISQNITEYLIYTTICFYQQGALTHGDRRATESRDLSRYNFDNKVLTNISTIITDSLVSSPVSTSFCFKVAVLIII